MNASFSDFVWKFHTEKSTATAKEKIMTTGEIVTAALIPTGTLAVGLLLWLDFRSQRNERKIRRQKRNEHRRLSRIRSLVWSNLLSLRKNRRLTDQRVKDTDSTQQ
jgi:uncharacterized protein (UPF0218 family)